MKLDIECVRDVMSFCEDSTILTERLEWELIPLQSIVDGLPSYTKPQIAYTLLLIEEAGLIELEVVENDFSYSIIRVKRLTYRGHEFIDTIRSKSVWKSITDSLSEISHISLPVLQQIGSRFLINSLGI